MTLREAVKKMFRPMWTAPADQRPVIPIPWQTPPNVYDVTPETRDAILDLVEVLDEQVLDAAAFGYCPERSLRDKSNAARARVMELAGGE